MSKRDGRARTARLPAFTAGIGRLPMLVVLLVGFMGISAVVGFFVSAGDQAKLRDYRLGTRDVRDLQQALTDAETGVRGFVLTGQFEYLEPYISGTQAIDGRLAPLLPVIDSFTTTSGAADGEAAPVSHRITTLRAAWRTAVALAEANQRTDADASLQTSQSKALMDALRTDLRRYLIMRNTDAEQAENRIAIQQDLLLLINALGAIVAIGAMIYGFLRSARDAKGRELAMATSAEARSHIELLFSMADMLQSATDRADANDVLRATAARLLPGFHGALYVFNNSRDRLDLSTTWGDSANDPVVDHIGPTACWALKRGKPHINTSESHALRCEHATLANGALELPMAARGEVYGLLVVGHEADDARARLTAIQPLAIALADAMSLSLSSIALREKLRNQALRDGLTGLYNRRFLEEMLERLTLDAERRKVPIAAVMIDLDHFKHLNDQHGHAAGDAVLRAVAGAITSSLRATDVACRYGGEELALLLPDCSVEHAVTITEQIRVAIAAATFGQAAQVTASFGVAAIPQTCARADELLPAADAALYQAKQQGRDRVVTAPARPSATTISLHGPAPAASSAD